MTNSAVSRRGKYVLLLSVLILLGISMLLSGCDIQINTCGGNCPQGNSHEGSNGPGSSTGSTSDNNTLTNNGSVSCLGYEKTDPEVPDQGKTATFNVTVANGCVVIVQGVKGQNVGPYNWDNGAVAALGPGSYSFTIQDGSYQMASNANGRAAFCNAINWIQTNGKALSETYPLAGWAGC